MSAVRTSFRFRILALLACAAAPAAGRAGPAAEDIAARVRQYRADTGARVGVHVVRLADGKVLCDIQARQPLIPASNQKILTAAVALKRLGRDFGFRTRMGLAGKDLTVFGDGDPTTGDPLLAAGRKQSIYDVFDRWCGDLKRAGATKVPGDLVIRTGIFQPPHVHPDWPKKQLGRWYAAPAAGVNFHDNCVGITFKVSGREVAPVLRPVSRFLVVNNQVKVGKKHLWSCRFDGVGYKLTLTGTVKRTSPDLLPVAVPNPASLFACVLADRLVRGGIDIAGRIVITADPADASGPGKDFRLIATATTPLADALARCGKQSLNMMAECLLLRSAVGPARPATWESAARVARQVLQETYGLDGSQFVVADGSGFSKRNVVSPAAVTHLLRALAGEPLFVGSLPVAGEDGSLKRRLRAAPTRGRVVAKTGSLAGASALSGYVLDGASRPVVAFSLLTNGRTAGRRGTAKGMEDGICRILVRHVDAGAASGPAGPAPVTTRPARRQSPRPGP